MSLNIVLLLGNLTRDPEVTYTPKGTACANFGIAVNKVWFNDAGQKHESVTFVDITAWEKGAEWAGEYLKKGAEVHVTGELKLDTWDDKTTGDKRSKLKVIAHKLTPTFGTWRDGGRKPSDEEAGRTQAPGRRTPQQPKPPADPDLDVPEDGGVPF